MHDRTRPTRLSITRHKICLVCSLGNINFQKQSSIYLWCLITLVGTEGLKSTKGSLFNKKQYWVVNTSQSNWLTVFFFAILYMYLTFTFVLSDASYKKIEMLEYWLRHFCALLTLSMNTSGKKGLCHSVSVHLVMCYNSVAKQVKKDTCSWEIIVCVPEYEAMLPYGARRLNMHLLVGENTCLVFYSPTILCRYHL